MTTSSQLREQASEVSSEIISKLSEVAPETLSIVELYDQLVDQNYDERAIRTAMWDRISSDEVEIIGGSALKLVMKKSILV